MHIEIREKNGTRRLTGSVEISKGAETITLAFLKGARSVKAEGFEETRYGMRPWSCRFRPLDDIHTVEGRIRSAQKRAHK